MAGLARGLPTRDIFESAVNFEELHYHRGFVEGFKDGVEAGKVEGREVGLKSGFQAGEEIGFYSGCVDLWKAALGVDATAFTPRARRTIRQFEDQLRTYPLSDPENERLHDLIEAIRGLENIAISRVIVVRVQRAAITRIAKMDRPRCRQ